MSEPEDNLKKRLDHYVTREYIKAAEDFKALFNSTETTVYGFKEHDGMTALEARMKAFDDMLEQLHLCKSEDEVATSSNHLSGDADC